MPTEAATRTEPPLRGHDHLLPVVQPITSANQAVPDVLTRPPPLAIEPDNPAFERWYSNRVPLRMTAQTVDYSFKNTLWKRMQDKQPPPPPR